MIENSQIKAVDGLNCSGTTLENLELALFNGEKANGVSVILHVAELPKRYILSLHGANRTEFVMFPDLETMDKYVKMWTSDLTYSKDKIEAVVGCIKCLWESPYRDRPSLIGEHL